MTNFSKYLIFASVLILVASHFIEEVTGNKGISLLPWFILVQLPFMFFLFRKLKKLSRFIKENDSSLYNKYKGTRRFWDGTEQFLYWGVKAKELSEIENDFLRDEIIEMKRFSKTNLLILVIGVVLLNLVIIIF